MIKKNYSFIERMKFDFERQKRGKDFELFFFRFFGNLEPNFIEEINLFSLIRLLDKIVRKI